MGRFVDIDLSGLPPPDVVETLSYAAIKAALIEDATARLNAAGIAYDVGALESDPVVKILEAAGYRELLLRQRINDAARAVMLASAVGSDLDHLAALYKTERMEGESDARFLERVQLAPEALSMGGPAGAYIYHALSMSLDVRDAAVAKPSAGHVQVFVMAASGTPPDDLLTALTLWLRDENRIPFTDSLSVHLATPVVAAIAATLSIGRGPAPDLVRSTARARLDAYLAERRRIGRTVAESGIKAALTVAGVESIALASPLTDLVPPVGGYIDVTSVDIAITVAS